MATISRKKETDGGMDSGALMTTLMAFQNGDFSARMPGDLTGVHGKIADTLNTIIDQSNEMVVEFTRVGHAVGKDEKFDIRKDLPNLEDAWNSLLGSGNAMTDNLVSALNELVRKNAQAMIAVAQVCLGEAQVCLGEKITVDARGEIGSMMALGTHYAGHSLKANSCPFSG